MWMSLRARVEGVLQHELDGVDDVLVARLDLGLALHADELLEVAEVDARAEVALGALDRVAQAVELGDAPCRMSGSEATTSSTSRPDDAAEGVDALEVEGVGAGHLELAVVDLERDHAVAPRERPRDLRLDEVGVELQRVDADVGEARRRAAIASAITSSSITAPGPRWL